MQLIDFGDKYLNSVAMEIAKNNPTAVRNLIKLIRKLEEMGFNKIEIANELKKPTDLTRKMFSPTAKKREI